MEWRSHRSAFEVVLGRVDARKIRGETPVPCDAGAWKGIRVRDGLMALAPGPSGCTVDVEMRVLRLSDARAMGGRKLEVGTRGTVRRERERRGGLFEADPQERTNPNEASSDDGTSMRAHIRTQIQTHRRRHLSRAPWRVTGVAGKLGGRRSLLALRPPPRLGTATWPRGHCLEIRDSRERKL